MTQQKLNRLFKSALINPLDQSIWNQIDLILLDLKYKGYIAHLQSKDINCKYRVVKFNKKAQQIFIKNEIKKLLYMELYTPLQQLLSYRKDILPKWLKIKRRIKVYESNYFIIENKTLYINYSNHPLINWKLDALINRRLKHTCENNKKN